MAQTNLAAIAEAQIDALSDPRAGNGERASLALALAYLPLIEAGATPLAERISYQIHR